MPWVHRPKASQCAPVHPSAKLCNWPTACAVQPRGGGGGALKERFCRGVSPRPSNLDPVFKTAHDWEAHIFLNTSQKKSKKLIRLSLILSLKTEYRKNSIAIVSLLDLAPPESVCTTQPCEYLKNLSQRFTPCNGLYGEAPSLRGTFFQASGIWKRKD